MRETGRKEEEENNRVAPRVLPMSCDFFLFRGKKRRLLERIENGFHGVPEGFFFFFLEGWR